RIERLPQQRHRRLQRQQCGTVIIGSWIAGGGHRQWSTAGGDVDEVVVARLRINHRPGRQVLVRRLRRGQQRYAKQRRKQGPHGSILARNSCRLPSGLSPVKSSVERSSNSTSPAFSATPTSS